MTKRIFSLACSLMLATTACSRGTPTEPAAEPSIPVPDRADREDHATPPKP